MPTMTAEREERRSGGERGNGATGAVGGFFQRLKDAPGRFRTFLHEARVELKHVSWPTRDDVKATTIVVLVTIFVFGAFLFGVDSLVSFTVTRVLEWFK